MCGSGLKKQRTATSLGHAVAAEAAVPEQDDAMAVTPSSPIAAAPARGTSPQHCELMGRLASAGCSTALQRYPEPCGQRPHQRCLGSERAELAGLHFMPHEPQSQPQLPELSLPNTGCQVQGAQHQHQHQHHQLSLEDQQLLQSLFGEQVGAAGLAELAAQPGAPAAASSATPAAVSPAAMPACQQQQQQRGMWLLTDEAALLPPAATCAPPATSAPATSPPSADQAGPLERMMTPEAAVDHHAHSPGMVQLQQAPLHDDGLVQGAQRLQEQVTMLPTKADTEQAKPCLLPVRRRRSWPGPVTWPPGCGAPQQQAGGTAVLQDLLPAATAGQQPSRLLAAQQALMLDLDLALIAMPLSTAMSPSAAVAAGLTELSPPGPQQMAQQQDEAVTTSREHQALYQHTLQQQQQRPFKTS